MRESRKNLQDLDWYFGTSESAQDKMTFKCEPFLLPVIEKI